MHVTGFKGEHYQSSLGGGLVPKKSQTLGNCDQEKTKKTTKH